MAPNEIRPVTRASGTLARRTATRGALGSVSAAAQEGCAFVIFGASGDLTSRKLVPALYNLSCQELLPSGFAVVGFSLRR